MSQPDIKYLLDRYVRDETSPEENELVEQWLIQNDDLTNPWDLLDEIGQAQWLNKVYHKINLSIQQDHPKIEQLSKRKLWWIIAGVAATLTIFFTLLVGWPLIKSHFISEELALVSVNPNQKKSITLSDGSTVCINTHTNFKFPKSFAGKTREVYLSGEAYFDIKHDAEKPFIVHTGKLSTIVLGTAFNINTDEKMHTIEITVTRGKVSVINENQTLGIITPNQQMTFNNLTKRHEQSEVDAKKVIAWREQNLIFDDVTFETAINQLQQRFQVKIYFANEKLKHCRFSGTSAQGEKLEDVLNIICSFNKATYKSNSDGTITINGSGCN